jgi:hypothetical protein
LKYSEEASDLIVKFPAKLLWPELLKFFEGKSPETITDSIKVLSKMDIV